MPIELDRSVKGGTNPRERPKTVRPAPSPLSRELRRCTNGVDQNRLLRYSMVGGSAGAIASTLIPVFSSWMPVAALSGMGTMLGAAMAIREDKELQSRIDAYPQRLEEIRYHPGYAKETVDLPSDLSRCNPTLRAKRANLIHDFYQRYITSPAYQQARESAEGVLAQFWQYLEDEKAKRSDITFEALSKRQVQTVTRTIKRHPKLQCALENRLLEDGRGKIDILFTIPEKDQHAAQTQRDREEAIEAHEQACDEAGSENVISLATWFTLRGVPFIHINPDPLPSTDAVRHDTSAATSAVSPFPAQPASQLRQRRGKRANVHPEPAAASPDRGRTKPAKAAAVITYGAAMQRQVDRQLPAVCAAQLQKISQDLCLGRCVRKTVNGMLAYDISMGSANGRGAWRLLVKKLPTPGTAAYEFYGIVDYHKAVPEFW